MQDEIWRPVGFVMNRRPTGELPPAHDLFDMLSVTRNMAHDSVWIAPTAIELLLVWPKEDR